jgi:hypothetical protein
MAEVLTEKKFKNPHRISVKTWRAQEGLLDEDAYTEFLGRLVCDSIAPAMCDDGCEVEPDGRCEHGCPSILLAIGMI